jgi:hypothetical protein
MKDRFVSGGLLSTARSLLSVPWLRLGAGEGELGVEPGGCWVAGLVVAHCWALGNHTPVSKASWPCPSSGEWWWGLPVGTGAARMCGGRLGWAWSL